MSKEKSKKIQKAVKASFSENRTKTVEQLAKEVGVSLPTFCRHRKAYKDEKSSIKITQESFNAIQDKFREHNDKLRALKISEQGLNKRLAELYERVQVVDMRTKAIDDRFDYIIEEMTGYLSLYSTLKRAVVSSIGFGLMYLLLCYFFSN